MIGKYEFLALLALGFLILLILINKPLCAVCFFVSQPAEFIHLPKGSSLEGIVIKEPEVRYTNQHIEMTFQNKRILIVANRYQQVVYGDRIRVVGEIGPPRNNGSFDYAGYLLRQHIQGITYYPRISIVRHNEGSSLMARIYLFKDFLRAPILKGLPEPHASFILSMTLGDDWRISPQFRDALVRSGTIHIVSISGFHMTVITIAVFLLFIMVGFSRTWATVATIIAISGYIFFVGLPSAAIRSGIMATLVLLAYLIGRIHRLFYGLLLAAILMLLWDSSLLFDIGFQLSFGAMLGLAIFYQPFRAWFHMLPRVSNYAILDIVPASFAANVAIFPFLAYHFGSISFISPLANVLVLPVIPVIMVLGFIVEIIGIGISPLWFLLEYATRIISLLGSI